MLIQVDKKTSEDVPKEKFTSRRARFKSASLIVIAFLSLYFLVQGREKFSFKIDDNVSHFEVDSSAVRGDGVSDIEKDEQLSLGLTPRAPVVIRNVKTGQERKLHGRFLHITDVHPDPYYVEGSSIEKVCHESKPDSKKDYAPKFGKATAGCDSSVELMDHTFKWIKDNLRDKIDFVIWTGDNIRHDNDRKNPRTEFQIFEMNDIVSDKMHSLFANHTSEDPRNFDVIVIPSLGNNDVFPHNMFSLGPTLQTREYYKIWNDFVPQEQQRSFERGASFVSEVIPGKLAVLSINTLYLYKANPLVDNCDSKKEPGYQLLLWLGSVLEELRQRGMKVWLSGHVPPIEKNYADSCFDKFTLWTYEYRDIIIGSIYGHMNMDHFIPVNGKASRKAIQERANSRDGTESPLDFYDDVDDDELFLEHAVAASEAHSMGAKPVNKESYMNSVRGLCYERVQKKIEEAQGPGEEGVHYSKHKGIEEISKRYSIVNIAGSVIPTFNPSFRIWEYNITGLEAESKQLEQRSWDKFYETLDSIMEESLNEIDDDMDEPHGAVSEEDQMKINKKKKGSKKKKKKKSPDKTIPKEKPKNIPLGPAFTNQLFSPTKFVQYYADLKKIDKDYSSMIEAGQETSHAADKAFKYQVEYTSEDDPYPMEGLLVKDYITLASKLAANKKMWKKFMKRAFISSGYKDDMDD